MDINYHYFVVKTLACHAGFQEKDAQTIAYYSQQVDNFNLCEPVCVEQKPPQFFFDHHYAKKAARNLWRRPLERNIGIRLWLRFILFLRSPLRCWRRREILPERITAAFLPARSLLC